MRVAPTKLNEYVASIRSDVWKKIAGLKGDSIVILGWEGQSQKFCNLLRVDQNGQIIWTVQPQHPLEGLYSDAFFNKGSLVGRNMCGFLDTIDYETGKAIHALFTK